MTLEGGVRVRDTRTGSVIRTAELFVLSHSPEESGRVEPVYFVRTDPEGGSEIRYPDADGLTGYSVDISEGRPALFRRVELLGAGP